MSLDGNPIEKSKFQVRPGLLLFAIVFFGLFLLSPVVRFLKYDHPTVRESVFVLGIIAWLAACFFLFRDSGQHRPIQMSIAFVSMSSIAIAGVAFVLFAMLPLRTLISAHLEYVVRITLMPGAKWGRVLAEIGWLSSFFGRGRSRLLLVASSTTMLMLWGAI